MIEQLIKRAKKIETETDANIGGALIQVTAELSLAQCKAFFAEWAGNDEKKIKRYSKKINRVQDENNSYFNIYGLRQDVSALLESARNPRSDKNYLW